LWQQPAVFDERFREFRVKRIRIRRFWIWKWLRFRLTLE